MLAGDQATPTKTPPLYLRNAFSALHHGEENYYNPGSHSARSYNSESSSEDFRLASPAKEGRRPPGVPPLAISALFQSKSEAAAGAMSSKSTGTAIWTGTGSGSAENSNSWSAPNYSFRSPLSPTPRRTPRRLSKLSPPAIQKVPLVVSEPMPADAADSAAEEGETQLLPSNELCPEEDCGKAGVRTWTDIVLTDPDLPEPADEFTTRHPPFSDRRALSSRAALSARMGGA